MIAPGMQTTRRTATSNEILIGDNQERLQLLLDTERAIPITKDYLTAHLQRVRPGCKAALEKVQSLEEFLAIKADTRFDYDFFNTVSKQSTMKLHQQYPLFAPLAQESFIVGSSKKYDVGGFHGSTGIGFQYISHFAFSTLLSDKGSPDVRALELLRCYLHDSLHAATYRTFSLAGDKVYRKQYGLNVRNSEGNSYSGIALTKSAPHAINLNLLMDGIVTIVTANTLKDMPCIERNDFDREILADICGQYEHISRPEIKKFVQDVVVPSRKFLNYWGGEDIKNSLLLGMLSGDLAPLERDFAQGIADRSNDAGLQQYLASRIEEQPVLADSPAWDKLFRSKNYYDT